MHEECIKRNQCMKAFINHINRITHVAFTMEDLRCKRLLDEDLKTDNEILIERLNSIKDLLARKNFKIEQIFRELHACKEETANWKKLAEDSVDTFIEKIAQGLFKVIKRIEEFPSIFNGKIIPMQNS